MHILTPAQTAWLDEYSRPEPIPQSTVEWIHQIVGSSPHLRETLQQFPPSCVVIANQDLGCPRQGRLGVVINMGYGYDPSVNAPTIQLKVIEANVPGEEPGPYAAMCDPEWLEVVGYWSGLTPDAVKSILESLDN